MSACVLTTTAMSVLGPKSNDFAQPPCKMSTDAATTKPTKSPQSFDMNIAKKTICFVWNYDEDLVQLVIDTLQLDHRSPISSTTDLLDLVEKIATIPHKQEELKRKLNQYQVEQKEVENAKVKEQTDNHVPSVQNKDVDANSELSKTSAEMLKSVVTSGEALKNQSSKDTLEELTRKNRELKKRRMCRACKVVELATSGITFLPCGHFITCEKCSESFEDCPCCGKSIMGTVRTYLS